MSSGDKTEKERVEGTRSESSGGPLHSSGEDPKEERMKRAAVKQLIERYYYQLTDGCGKPDCSNVVCASCQKFQFPNLTRDQAAVEALKQFRLKAELCGDSPYKVAKSSSEQKNGCSSNDPDVRSDSCVVSHVSLQSHDKPARPDNCPLEGTSSEKMCTSSSSKNVPSPAASGNIMDASPTQIEGAQSSAPEVKHLSESSLLKIIEECEAIHNWSYLIRTIGSVFNNPDSLLKSFLKCESPNISKEELHSMEVDMDKDTDDRAGYMETEAADSDGAEEQSPSISNEDSPHHGHVKLKRDEVSVDVASMRRAFTKLFSLPNSPFQSSLSNALRSLSRTVEMEFRYHQAYERNNEYLNIFIIVFEILTMDSRGDLENAIPHIFRAAGLLPLAAQAKLARVWAKYPQDKLKEILGFLHQVITLKILSTQWSSVFTFNDDHTITGAAEVMRIVYYACVLGGQMDPIALLEREKDANRELEESMQELLEGAMGREKERLQPKEDPLGKELGVNSLDCRKPLIPWEDFVNDLVSDGIRMEKDYANYKADGDKFSFLSHPFLLTTAMKNLGMYYDSKIRMVNERRVSLLQSLVNGAPTVPYLRIRIRRDHVIDDALVNLEMVAMDNPQDLKKQLYVEFEDEQGIDEGGVSKEFFQLVLEEIFNPDIGMFTYDEETKNFWFNSTSFENDSQFTLIGIVLGLAIYNSVILDIHFPMVVYRKLMGKLGTFEDLKDSHVTLAKGLMELLEYDGDVEEMFMQTFCVSYTDVFGSTITQQLKTNGDRIPVTNDNRQNFDFHALEEATEYDGGFTAASPVIRYFWEVVHAFSEEQQRKLLQFATGSDCVPVGGLSKLKLVIARHGPDSDRLPTAHTCFNVLLLPDYSSKEKLEERLSKAINYAKGFGML
ncbi:hypothetical protein LSH36_451g01060 [Paralvinella palmiformis]|uniref:Ubiquitin-protein ligase E3A n=1 Tax=Paralvinella palmiformis TaxID=53620 RepID=A0AAD9JB27_9ANNE|nr:hypothetical protein LSH36_451g01060 [Paralvinella palmiformis]